MVALVTLATMHIGCSSGPSAEAKKTCKQAGVKYATCIKETVGMTVPSSGAGVDQCAKDSKTVTMYKECLPKKDCKAFLKCMDDYVAKTKP